MVFFFYFQMRMYTKVQEKNLFFSVLPNKFTTIAMHFMNAPYFFDKEN